MNGDAPIPYHQHFHSMQPITFIEELPINGRNQRVPVVELQPGQARALQCITELSRPTGGFRAFGAGPLLRACIQFSAIRDVYSARLQILQLRNLLIGLVNTMIPALARGGGGCRDLDVLVRRTSEATAHLDIVVTVEVPDRSDAHLIDVLVAKLAPYIEQLTNGVMNGASISEVAGRQLLCAQATFDPGNLSLAAATGCSLAGRIVELHNFTCIAKNRVGARNADVLATANSTLVAMEAASGGKLGTWKAHEDLGGPLVIWYRDHHGHLAGRISLPVMAGQTEDCCAAMDIGSAQTAAAANAPRTYPVDLAVAAIGLAQSLVNLHAHAAEAIAQGDPGQHACDLALLAGAREAEINHVVKTLLSAQHIRFDLAVAALDQLRER